MSKSYKTPNKSWATKSQTSWTPLISTTTKQKTITYSHARRHNSIYSWPRTKNLHGSTLLPGLASSLSWISNLNTHKYGTPWTYSERRLNNWSVTDHGPLPLLSMPTSTATKHWPKLKWFRTSSTLLHPCMQLLQNTSCHQLCMHLRNFIGTRPLKTHNPPTKRQFYGTLLLCQC